MTLPFPPRNKTASKTPMSATNNNEPAVAKSGFTEVTFFDGEREVMVHQETDGTYSRAYTYVRDLAEMPQSWQVKTSPSLNPLFVNILNPSPAALVRKLRNAGYVAHS